MLTWDKQVREIFETVVVVLILVSLLRIFGAEAFEIPSGSMATTLLGAHKVQECPECGFKSLVNARSEVEGDDSGMGAPNRTQVRTGSCQNCGKVVDLKSIKPSSGDRVLVAKYWYDGIAEPRRWDIPVFKCPETHNGIKNYIKRLVGLPNETIRIWYGHLLVAPPKSETFEIARRPPAVMLAVRRIVFDADFPPKDLQAQGIYRWTPTGAGLAGSGDGKVWKSDGSGEASMVYRHRIGMGRVGGMPGPSLITDLESYNSENVQRPEEADVVRKANWVRDLMLECRINVAAAAGTTTLELNAGKRRYRLALDLQSGDATIFQNDRKLETQKSGIHTIGEHLIRFADFDERLTVWIDDKLVFGDGVPVEMSKVEEMGPYLTDFEPAKIHVSNARVDIRALKLYRNTYYLQTSRWADGYFQGRFPVAAMTEPSEGSVSELRDRLSECMQTPVVLKIDADSFLMMGDNSPQSFDGRDWGLTHFVPRKMLLGRALSVYWPLWNWKFVR